MLFATPVRLTSESPQNMLSMRSFLPLKTMESDSYPEAVSDSFGLRGMKKRLESVGGTIQIISAAGIGTRIQAAVPLPRLYRFGSAYLGRKHEPPQEPASIEHGYRVLNDLFDSQSRFNSCIVSHAWPRSPLRLV